MSNTFGLLTWACSKPHQNRQGLWKIQKEMSLKSERSNWLELICGVLLASGAHGVLQPASKLDIKLLCDNSLRLWTHIFHMIIETDW